MGVIWGDSCGDNYDLNFIVANGSYQGFWDFKSADLSIVTARTGNGINIATPNGFSSYYGYLGKTLPTNYGDITVGLSQLIPSASVNYFPVLGFWDNFNCQIGLVVSPMGELLLVTNVPNSALSTAGFSGINILWASPYGTVVSGSRNHYGLRVLAKTDTTGTATIYLNGQPLHTVTGVRTTTTANPYINQLVVYGSNAVVDDVYILKPGDGINDTFLGDQKVYFNQIDANGNLDQFTIGGSSPAATNWQSINGVIPGNLVNFVYANAINQIDKYRSPSPSLAISSISAVLWTGSMRADSGGISSGASLAPIFQKGDGTGGIQVGNTFLLGTTDIINWQVYDKNPVTALAWDISDFPIFTGAKRIA